MIQQPWNPYKPTSISWNDTGILNDLGHTAQGGPSTKVEINKTFGIPLPTLSAFVGPLLLLAGSGMYLTGIPVAGRQGAVCCCGCGRVGSFMLVYCSLEL